tara:strand:+ start:205 stop:615 length:411 start_codon:yes stop_codon:yes gene_type:complete
MIGSDFHATIKLITGEEIFALVSVDNTEEDPVIIMQSPVIMKVLSTGRGSMMKIRPWLEVPGDDIYIIKYDRIITMSEVKDKMIISMYTTYCDEGDFDFGEFINEESSNHEVTKKMGYISNVEDARKKLEDLFKDT